MKQAAARLTSVQHEGHVRLRHLIAQVRQEHVLDDGSIRQTILVQAVSVHDHLRPATTLRYTLKQLIEGKCVSAVCTVARLSTAVLSTKLNA